MTQDAISRKHFDERIRTAGGMVWDELSEDYKGAVCAILEMLKTEPSVTAEKTEKGKWQNGKLFLLRGELKNGKMFFHKVTKVTNDNTIVGALLENGTAIYFPLANLNYWGVTEIKEDEK